jgi:sec-independent protein translocase protein TatA
VNLGPFELIVIIVLLLLVFGPMALPRITRNLGKSLGSFKKGLRDVDVREEIRGTLEREEPPADPAEAAPLLPAKAPPGKPPDGEKP